MDVTVRCPLAYAPLKYLKSLPQEQLSKVKRKMYTKGNGLIIIINLLKTLVDTPYFSVESTGLYKMK